MPRGRLALILAACLAVSLFAVVSPMYVIQPFRAQGPRELAAALAILRWKSLITVLSALAALIAIVAYWRAQSRPWPRAFAVVTVAAVALLALLARVNVYEQMFHPAGKPAFASAADTHLDRDEMVLAVRLGAEARAYPVRSISYHHVINDVVDGKPIVATY
jgi:hypothetical protein